MKWIFRIIFVILIVFASLIGIGFFLPATQTIERHIQINAYAEDVFPLINDLRISAKWDVDAYRDGHLENIAFGGPDHGVGQTAAWQTNQKPPVTGTREIIESQSPEFVRSRLNVNGVLTTQTYGISSFDDVESGGIDDLGDQNSETIDVLLRIESELNDFPYLHRLTAKLTESRVKARLDRTLLQLKNDVETQSSTLISEK